MDSYSIPASVKFIGNFAFLNCANLTSVYFEGDAPEFGLDIFYSVTVSAYYPAENPTWTSDMMQDYGGTITWIPYIPSPFTDVPIDSFYADPVLWAVENSITTGATADSFNPNGQCLRAHVVTFLYRANGNPVIGAGTNPFTEWDVSRRRDRVHAFASPYTRRMSLQTLF